MRLIPLALAALLLLPCAAAHADCQSGIAAAMRRANRFPASPGRAALLEQIQRADVAHHEGDEAECQDQLRDATSVLDKIDAAKTRGAPRSPADGGRVDPRPSGP